MDGTRSASIGRARARRRQPDRGPAPLRGRRRSSGRSPCRLGALSQAAKGASGTRKIGPWSPADGRGEELAAAGRAPSRSVRGGVPSSSSNRIARRAGPGRRRRGSSPSYWTNRVVVSSEAALRSGPTRRVEARGVDRPFERPVAAAGRRGRVERERAVGPVELDPPDLVGVEGQDLVVAPLGVEGRRAPRGRAVKTSGWSSTWRTAGSAGRGRARRSAASGPRAASVPGLGPAGAGLDHRELGEGRPGQGQGGRSRPNCSRSSGLSRPPAPRPGGWRGA